jgi:hypothetical protein
MTRIEDVGRLVAGACALGDVWDPQLGDMVGDVVTYNKVIELAEEVTGEKFTVEHLPIERLRKEIADKQDDWSPEGLFSTFYQEVLITIAQGGDNWTWRDTLGKRTGIESTKVKEYLGEWWRRG